MPRGKGKTGLRTDLLEVPGGQYGENKNLQDTVNLASTPAGGGPAMPPPGAGGPPADPMAGFSLARPPIPAGAPSMRPDEGVMTGFGDPMLEQAFMPPPAPHLRALALLNSLGDEVSPQVKALREVLNASEANGTAT